MSEESDSLDSAEASEKPEFVRLAEFITTEHQKKAAESDPQFKLKIVHISKYQNIQSKKFEEYEQQKGIQINRAA